MTAQPGRPLWTYGKLYDFLYSALPECRTPRNIIDVPRLATLLNLSKEGFYKILRRGHMPATHARSLHELSVLQNPSAPPLSEFYDFVN